MNYIIVSDENTSGAGRIMAAGLYDALLEGALTTGDFVFRILLGEREEFEDCRYALTQMEPDVIVIFDMAGMWMADDAKETIYNYMYCKCVHFLTKEPWHYPDAILRRMSIGTSVVVGSSCGKDYLLKYFENIPEVRQINWLGEGDVIRGFVREGVDVIVADYEDEEQLGEELFALPQVFTEIAKKIRELFEVNNQCCLPQEIVCFLEEAECSFTEGEVAELTTTLKNVERIYRIRELTSYLEREALDKKTAVYGSGWGEWNFAPSNLQWIEQEDGILCSQELIISMMDWIR